MITKIYEFYKMLTERAFTYEDTKNCYLLRSITKKEVKLCLYNYVTKDIVGYITADKDPRYDYLIIRKTSAEKGWGPFMYSLMFQTVYPMGIKPSKTIRPAALNVYKQFYTNTNVIKTPITESDLNYTTTWQPDVSLPERESPEETKYINHVFKMVPSNWYLPFVHDSEEFIKEENINVNAIFKQCLDYFESKYSVSAEAVNIPTKDITDKYLILNSKVSSCEFLIQDKSKIYGYAELIKKSGYYQVINIAAEQGWGPFLYDTLMVYLDMPIRPNRSLTREAWNVWNIYNNERQDVIKKPVSEIWDSVDLDHKNITQSHIVEPVNYLYTINDSKRQIEARGWLDGSKKLFVDQMVKVMPDWIIKRFNQAKLWFNHKYPMHR